MDNLTSGEKLICLAMQNKDMATKVVNLPIDDFKTDDRLQPLIRLRNIIEKVVEAGEDKVNRIDLITYFDTQQEQVNPHEKAAITSVFNKLQMAYKAKDDSAASNEMILSDHKKQIKKARAKQKLASDNPETKLAALKELEECGVNPEKIANMMASIHMKQELDDAEPLVAFDYFKEKDKLPFETLPIKVQIVASYLARCTNEQITLKHIMAASAILGAAIGKKAEIHNWGSDYYCNLAVAILLPSGGNKSGLYNVIRKLTREILNVNSPTASTIEAFLDHHCTTIPPDKRRTKIEWQERVRQIHDQHRADFQGNMVLVDELRHAMLSTLLPKEQATRNGQILCRLLDRDDIYCQTITGGTRIIGDTCFTWLGFSQTDPWNEEVRSANFQAGGLAARIIPINEQRFNFLPCEPLPASEHDATKAILSIVNADFDGHKKIKIEFQNEGLSKAKAWFAEKPAVKQAMDDFPNNVQLLTSKMLMQSAKLAAIWAVCDLEDFQPTVDANKWLYLAYNLIGLSHIFRDDIDNLLAAIAYLEDAETICKIKSG